MMSLLSIGIRSFLLHAASEISATVTISLFSLLSQCVFTGSLSCELFQGKSIRLRILQVQVNIFVFSVLEQLKYLFGRIQLGKLAYADPANLF